MTSTELTNPDFTTRDDPFALFGDWLEEATKSEVNDPTATALATAAPDGLPNVRMVLLKDFDERGFVFYTNFESQKGEEILSNMQAAMCFHWKSLRSSGAYSRTGLDQSAKRKPMSISSRVRAAAA
jgi:pyridoxamine 5'-phosphate oxidase